MKENSNKIIAIVALVVAVIALAVGFATYTATLTISAHDVTVGSDTFSPNVIYKAGTIDCSTVSTGATVVSAGSFTDDVTWDGVEISLAEPGDYATCTATVINNSTFIAYLYELKTASALTCESKATSDNPATTGVSDACAGMELSVTHGTTSITADSTAAGQAGGASGTAITGNSIAANGGEKTVSFTVTYTSGSAKANGDFLVHIPQISMIYKTED